jgi:hypothetical protein
MFLIANKSNNFSAKRQAPSAKRQAPSAKRQAPSAKRQALRLSHFPVNLFPDAVIRAPPRKRYARCGEWQMQEVFPWLVFCCCPSVC